MTALSNHYLFNALNTQEEFSLSNYLFNVPYLNMIPHNKTSAKPHENTTSMPQKHGNDTSEEKIIRFVGVTAEATEDRDLAADLLGLFTFICKWANPDTFKSCVSYTKIHERFKWSDDTIKKKLTALVSLAYISCEKQENKHGGKGTNVYTILKGELKVEKARLADKPAPKSEVAPTPEIEVAPTPEIEVVYLRNKELKNKEKRIKDKKIKRVEEKSKDFSSVPLLNLFTFSNRLANAKYLEFFSRGFSEEKSDLKSVMSQLGDKSKKPAKRKKSDAYSLDNCLKKVEQAKQSGDFSSLKPTVWAMYFISEHNKRMPAPLAVPKASQRGFAVASIRDGFLKPLETAGVTPDQYPAAIEALIESYKTLPQVGQAYKSSIPFDTFKREWIISPLLKLVVRELSPDDGAVDHYSSSRMDFEQAKKAELSAKMENASKRDTLPKHMTEKPETEPPKQDEYQEFVSRFSARWKN